MGFRKTKGALLSGVLALGMASAVTAVFADPDGDAGQGLAKGKAKNDVYIVRMVESPVVAYEGGLPGYQATKPRKGQKINPLDPKVVRYAGYLEARHDEAIARVGARKAYSYRYSFNGFAARMSAAQAEALKSVPGVLSIDKDELHEMDTSTTPGFLELSGSTGFWANTGARGENVIIGIVDSGAWPEHASFSDRTGVNGNATRDGKLGYQQIPGWHGRCVPGEAFTAADCNHKLIGARYYNLGWGGSDAVKARFPFEFASPRDWGGHGTHTATTAGGNANVAATGEAAVFGSISGIAPRARIAAYKVCWADTPTGGGCFNSDSVAAIDQAVADGVDVINFSISGTTNNFRHPVEIAFMFAADAGVFVAASAGNSGPTTATVAHPSPWLTTVAAGTHTRDGRGSTTLGNGATYSGASVASLAGPAQLIDSTSAGLAGASATAVRLCMSAADNGGSPVLDPSKVAGKIVLCDRGVNARVAKSQAVKAAGGIGMILVNTSANSINADLHFVPTVHLAHTDRAAIKAYAGASGATATINASTILNNAPAPFTASFSSRGPLAGAGGDLLKPDLIAPGQDILAGVAPPNNSGRLFDVYSGTSMSSPHVAGLAALFKEVHPDWSPMAIKSALMTTAMDVLDGGAPPAAENNPTVIFRQGAGHVRPSSALSPGLVFDAGFADWMAFICGVQPGSFCAPNQGIDPSDMNVASIAIGNLAGVQTVTRRVTNVSGAPQRFTASHTGMAGFNVTLPDPILIQPGQTKTFTVKFTRTTAALNAYTGGQLRLASDNGHVVRVPMVVAPVALAAPAAISGNGNPMSYNVTPGFTGTFAASTIGLVPAATITDTVGDDPTNGSCSLSAPNAFKVDVVVPAGIALARFSLFDADVSPGADIDLCVFNGTTLVGSSGTSTSAEEVNVSGPAAGTYTVVVHGWEVGTGSTFKLHTWLLDLVNAGNMTVTAPATVAIGETASVGLTFSGLAPATRYLGAVLHSGTPGPLPATLVRIDTP